MSEQLKAFIFDLDGVVVNTVELHFRAWQQVFADLDIPFSRADMDRFRGIHQREILLTYVHGLAEAQIAEYLARKDEYYRALLSEAREKILHEPVVNLLRDVKAHDLKVGLASSSVSARYVLEIVHLIRLFDAIADGATVRRPKPAPDIFVWVAGALGLHPGEIVVVEDGSAGVQGARNAGMFVVGVNVPDRPIAPHLNVSLAQLDFEQIAARRTLQINSATK